MSSNSAENARVSPLYNKEDIQERFGAMVDQSRKVGYVSQTV
jgi:hypothetical protein